MFGLLIGCVGRQSEAQLLAYMDVVGLVKVWLKSYRLLIQSVSFTTIENQKVTLRYFSVVLSDTILLQIFGIFCYLKLF